jgi:hypothetical protein
MRHVAAVAVAAYLAGPVASDATDQAPDQAPVQTVAAGECRPEGPRASLAVASKRPKLTWGTPVARRRRGRAHGNALLDLVPAVRPTLDDRTVGAAHRAARALSTDLDLEPSERAAYITLALFAFESESWSLTEDEVAARVGATARTVRNAISGLADKGKASFRIVKRGKALPNGSMAPRSRVVATLTELPDVRVHGLRGALALAFEPTLNLSTSLRLVLAVFLVHESEDGWSFPGPDLVATKTGLSKRTVVTKIRKLIDLGHLRPHYRRGEPTRYKVTPRFGLGQRGKIALPTRNDLHTKEIQQGDSSRAAANQLSIPFGDDATPRTVAVQDAFDAHQAICKAPPGPDAIRCLADRLSEGMTPKDIETVCHVVMDNQWRRERRERRSVESILHSKGQAIAFIDKVDPERAKALELRRPLAKTSAPTTDDDLGDWNSPAWKAKRKADAAKIMASPRPSFG